MYASLSASCWEDNFPKSAIVSARFRRPKKFGLATKNGLSEQGLFDSIAVDSSLEEMCSSLIVF
jgi:hypothetical protein